jgi:thioredoxin 1
MKKIVISIIGTVTVIILASIFLTDTLGKNVYGKTELHPETVKQLDDPNYQNIILPSKLEQKIKSSKETLVYFFSPTCDHCKETTPILMALGEDLDKQILQFNLLEFENGWEQYKIKGTPTIIKFKEGIEVERLEGLQDENTYISFLK